MRSSKVAANLSMSMVRGSVVNQSFTQHRGSMGDTGVQPMLHGAANPQPSVKSLQTKSSKPSTDEEMNREIDRLLDKMMRTPQIQLNQSLTNFENNAVPSSWHEKKTFRVKIKNSMLLDLIERIEILMRSNRIAQEKKRKECDEKYKNWAKIKCKDMKNQ